MGVRELQDALSEPGALTPAVAWPKSTTTAGDGTSVTAVLVSPDELAQRAGVSVEQLSLGAVITAEGYGGAKVGKAAAAVGIAQVVKAEAAARGTTITKLLTAGSRASAPSGFYGEQRGRYASTAQPPTRWSLRVARAVLDGTVPDIARGARHFLDPAVFKAGIQAGRPLGRLGDVLTSWMLKGGNDWIGDVPTVDPFHLVFLGPGGTAESREKNRLRILDIMKAGPQGPAPGDPDAAAMLAGALFALLGLGLGALLLLETYA